MRILAFEFSSPQRSIAIVQETALAASSAVCEVVETGTHSTRPIGMIEDVLRQARLEREQIDCVAVGLGPGSYTGVRTAIALAHGWQLARSVKLVGISSAQCLAAQARIEGITGRVVVVIDAQRNEFYLASYEVSPGDCHEIEPLRLSTVAELRERSKLGHLPLGPEVAAWFPRSLVIFPRASTLASLALRHSPSVSGQSLEPIYLREPSFVKAPPPRSWP